MAWVSPTDRCRVGRNGFARIPEYFGRGDADGFARSDGERIADHCDARCRNDRRDRTWQNGFARRTESGRATRWGNCLCIELTRALGTAERKRPKIVRTK